MVASYEYIWTYKNGTLIFNPEKRIFLAVVAFGEPVAFWDFSVRFKVNMKSFNRKNCCVVIDQDLKFSNFKYYCLSIFVAIMVMQRQGPFWERTCWQLWEYSQQMVSSTSFFRTYPNCRVPPCPEVTPSWSRAYLVIEQSRSKKVGPFQMMQMGNFWSRTSTELVETLSGWHRSSPSASQSFFLPLSVTCIHP